MVNLIQPIAVQQAYDGITHPRRWASWNWWWRMVDDDDGDESPSSGPRTDSRSSLPREIRAWRWLRIVKRDETFSLIFFSAKRNIWSWSWGRWSTRGPTRQGGAAPTLVDRLWAPSSWFFRQYFLYFPKFISMDFQVIPRTSVFCTINNTMAVLLKTASIQVSFIQIMQVRVQNKGKSVWKSRYDWDVSTPPSLNLCLSSSNSVDKLKVIKKNFYKLCLLLLL
mgnify:CR=1 FL=1